jgi:hypothetical protein
MDINLGITKINLHYTSVRAFTASPVLFDSLCELVSQNLWLGSKGYPNGRTSTVKY